MTKLQILRKQWTGTTNSRQSGKSSMMTPNNSNEMCCLGHLLCQLFPLEMTNYMVKMGEDFDKSQPLSMPVSGVRPLGLSTDDLPSWMVTTLDEGDITNSNAVDILAQLNDSTSIKQDVKEAGIAYILELYGYSVEFV